MRISSLLRRQVPVSDPPGLDQPPVALHFLNATDGVRVPQSRWEPSQPPRAVLVFVPGLDAASSDTEILAATLAAQGVATISTDLRGQGLWSGAQRGKFTNWRRWLADVRETTHAACALYPDAPLYLGGQSLGAVLAIGVAAEVPELRGLLLFSPAFAFLQPRCVPRCMIWLLSWLPWLRPRSGYSMLKSRGMRLMDEDEQEAYFRRPERTRLSLGMLNACHQAGAYVWRRLPQVHVPVLLHHGSDDHTQALVRKPQTVAERLAARIGTAGDQFESHLHAGGLHNLLRQRALRARVLAQCTAWLAP